MPDQSTKRLSGNVITRPQYVAYGDSPSIDAFARLRVSSPTTLFDSQLEYDKQPLIWGETLTAGGTSSHDANKSTVNMQVTTASGDAVDRQTFDYFRYEPGKSQLVMMTFSFSAAQTNLTQQVGYFDTNDGLFFESVSGTLYMTKRSSTSGSPVNTQVAQTDWNIDKFDGTGPSGVTLDVTKTQILVMDMEWLGVGRVRIGFVDRGQIFYAHQFLHSNVESFVYMKTAVLPVHYRIATTGTLGSTASMQHICSTVISEGGEEDLPDYRFSAGNSATKIAISATERPILSIRPAPTFNSITNRTDIHLRDFHLFSEGDAFYRIIYNGTLDTTNLSWTDVNSTASAVQFDVGSTAITGGITIESGYITAGGAAGAGAVQADLTQRYPFTLDNAGSSGSGKTFTLAVRTFSGNSSAAGTFKWGEFR